MKEQERKFMFVGEMPIGANKFNIQQGYLMFDGSKHLRIRIVDNDQCYLCYKNIKSSTVKDEYEYWIPYGDGINLMNSTNIKLTKTRYSTNFGGNHVDIDFYDNGIKVVEIEFESELITIPEYCGEELTAKKEYSNIYLAKLNSVLK